MDRRVMMVVVVVDSVEERQENVEGPIGETEAITY
jgi:hypothetical protein